MVFQSYVNISNRSLLVAAIYSVVMSLAILTYSTSVRADNRQPAKLTNKAVPVKRITILAENWWDRGKSNPVIHVIVNRALQRASVYSDGALLSQSNVSTGKAGFETPGGIFSILSKNRYHHSNIYSQSPMPFMQRLTWSGIALHESDSVPSYPASHGCVRLPDKFAGELYKFTKTGAQVIITSRDVRPERFYSPNMFPIGHGKILEANNVEAVKAVVSGIEKNSARESIKPLRVLITRHTGRQRVMEIQTILNELNYLAGTVDGWMGPRTGKAILSFQKDYRHKVTGSLTDELLDQLYRASGKGKPKNGHVYVRRDLKPLFDMPIVLADEETPLGTHHFTAVYPESSGDSGNGARSSQSSSEPFWLAMTIEQTQWPKKRKKGIDNESVRKLPPSAAQRAFERASMPGELKQKISALITPGSTIVIADAGFSRETGRGTDFIVLTRENQSGLE